MVFWKKKLSILIVMKLTLRYNIKIHTVNMNVMLKVFFWSFKSNFG